MYTSESHDEQRELGVRGLRASSQLQTANPKYQDKSKEKECIGYCVHAMANYYERLPFVTLIKYRNSY